MVTPDFSLTQIEIFMNRGGVFSC